MKSSWLVRGEDINEENTWLIYYSYNNATRWFSCFTNFCTEVISMICLLLLFLPQKILFPFLPQEILFLFLFLFRMNCLETFICLWTRIWTWTMCADKQSKTRTMTSKQDHKTTKRQKKANPATEETRSKINSKDMNIKIKTNPTENIKH